MANPSSHFAKLIEEVTMEEERMHEARKRRKRKEGGRGKEEERGEARGLILYNNLIQF